MRSAKCAMRSTYLCILHFALRTTPFLLRPQVPDPALRRIDADGRSLAACRGDRSLRPGHHRDGGDRVVGQGRVASAFEGRFMQALRRRNRCGWKPWRPLAVLSSCSPAQAAARPCCCPARIACCVTHRPSEILGALAGLDQSPSDLRAWIAGCPEATGQARNLRSYGADWAAADSESGRTIWIHRVPVSRAGARSWRLVAVKAGPLTVEFAEHTGTQPGRLRIRRAETAGVAALDVRLALRQVERGVELADAAFAIDVPADAVPITIEELRQSGPLRDGKNTSQPR